MCQLFALNSNTPSAATFSFTGLSARGGATGDHVDGFGLAFHDGRSCRVFIDEQRASDAALADFLRRHPIRARTVMAHVRKATQGPVTLENCHPFVREWQGRHWSFCHNGDLKGFAPRLHGNFRPVGGTDSELAFCWLMQELAKAHASVPSIAELTCTLRELLPIPAAHGTFNLLLSNGQALWAHASTSLHWLERAHPFGAAHLADEDLSVDFGALTQPGDRVAMVATQPLTRGEPWTAFAPGELRVFVDGQSLPAG